MEWHRKWFNDDYLKLYASRDEEEALGQVKFMFKNIPLRPGNHLLDVGTGSGRHAYLLAKCGLKVVGVDQSAALIRDARKKTSGKELENLSFWHGDILHYQGKNLFEVAISIFTSFGYYSKDRQNLSILEAIGKNLKPGGLFFLDYLHPEWTKKHLVPFEEKQIGQESVALKRRIEKDMVIKEIEFPKRKYFERVKLYDTTQLERLLLQSGLQVVKKWGSYNGEGLNAESRRQLLLSKRISL